MKGNKILHILLSLALIFTMCAPVAVKAETTFRVIAPNGPSTTETAFGYEGGSYDLVVITSDNSVWTAYPSASWITTSKKTGQASNPTVTISVAKSYSNTERTGSVIFKTAQSSNPNGVDPDKEPTDLYVEKTSLQAGATGQSFFVVAGSNRAWTATPDASWIYFIDPHTDHGAAGSTVIMYIGTRANTTGKTRVGHINVKAGDVTKTITITQNAQ